MKSPFSVVSSDWSMTNRVVLAMPISWMRRRCSRTKARQVRWSSSCTAGYWSSEHHAHHFVDGMASATASRDLAESQSRGIRRRNAG
ncbi:hypothetical protein ACLB1T_08880 [Escherichia coli]